MIIDPGSGEAKSVMVHERALSAWRRQRPMADGGRERSRRGRRAWSLDDQQRLGGDLPAHKSVSEWRSTNDQKRW